MTKRPGWRHVSVCLALLLASGTPGAVRGEPLASVVFTEVLSFPPASLGFPLGQWFELHNPSDQPVLLTGCGIQAGEAGMGQTFIITDSVVMMPGAFLVVGLTKAKALNGGIDIDLALGLSMALPRYQGFLRLLCEDQLVDEVTYGVNWGLLPKEGASISLEPTATTEFGNDDVSHWCFSDKQADGATLSLLASPGTHGQACDSDGDGLSEDDGDCNDSDDMVRPGMMERCNGQDDNCNGDTDEAPRIDQPPISTVGACLDNLPLCLGAAGYGWEEAGAYEPVEVSCDGVDNDCDGFVDEEMLNACGSCGPLLPDWCDGLDNDCDDLVDEDATVPFSFTCKGQGVGVCLSVTPQCIGEWTCSYPMGYQEEETLCDGLDNDCDGDTDEGFLLGSPCVSGTGSCASKGSLACATNGKDTRCDAPVVPVSLELCGDDEDNDCDGDIDEGFFLGETCFSGQGACRTAGKFFCSEDGLTSVCSALPLVAGIEVCENDLDDDCDGYTDEFPCSAAVDSTLGGCSSADSPPKQSLFCVKSAYPLSILIGLIVGLLWLLGQWGLKRLEQKGKGGRSTLDPEGP